MSYREEVIGGQRLILGDCLEVMTSLAPVPLIATDIPYNLGIAMGTGNDRVPDYDNFVQQWLDLCVQTLSPTGSLWFATSEDYIGKHVMWVDERFQNRRCVIWSRATPNYACKKSLSNMYEPLMYGAVSSTYTFNLQDVMVPANYAGAKTTIHSKKRAGLTISDTKNPTDLWKIESAFHSRVEYVGFKGQKPVALYERIVLLSSNPTDTVLDPFMGSGTTLVACENTGRSGIGIETNVDHFDIACRRVEAVVKQREAEQAQLSLTV